MSGDDGGAVLEVQHLAQPGHVIGQRGQRELGGGDVVAVGLQALDDAAPAGAVSPCAMDKHDVRLSIHLGAPFAVGLTVGLTVILRSEALDAVYVTPLHLPDACSA